MEVCSNQIPEGWIPISYRQCHGCCGADKNVKVQMPTIQRIDILPVGTALEVCSRDIPKGWVAISYANCNGCCGADPEIQVSKPTIKKISN